MKYVLITLFILGLTSPIWADEMEEAKLKVMWLQEKAWKLEAQGQLIEALYPRVIQELNEAKKALIDLQKKQSEKRVEKDEKIKEK